MDKGILKRIRAIERFHKVSPDDAVLWAKTSSGRIECTISELEQHSVDWFFDGIKEDIGGKGKHADEIRLELVDRALECMAVPVRKVYGIKEWKSAKKIACISPMLRTRKEKEILKKAGIEAHTRTGE